VRRGLLAAAAVALASSVASAHPVPVGRYAEIPYGIRPDHPFPTPRGGPRRTGRLRGRLPARVPRRLWDRALGAVAPHGPTLAADGSLYLGTRDGLVAMSPDGTERWRLDDLGTVAVAPSLTPSEDLVVATRNGVLALVDRDGVVRRRRRLASMRGGALVLDDGSVIVGTVDRRVHRLDADLRPVFDVPLADGTQVTPTLTRRGQIALASGQLLTLLDPRGQLRRQVSLGGRASSPAAVADDGTIWVTTIEGALVAVDAGGRVRSRTELGSRSAMGFAVGHDGAVRVPTLNAGLVCVDPDGTTRWTVPSSIRIHGPVVIDEDDTTLMVVRDRVIAVEADGTERWRFVVGNGNHLGQSPVLGADGTIYVALRNGRLQAWR